MKVLFLCFNKPLSQWIASVVKQPNVEVVTFHSLVGRLVNSTRIASKSNWSYDELTRLAPELLVDAASVLHAPGGDTNLLYDAIIVDEGQDFEDTWWIGIQDMLKEPDKGVFYVFFDDNQRIFTQISNIPMQTQPMYLDENLRNTQHIHARLKGYSRDGDIECVGPEGRPVEIIPVQNHTQEVKALQQVLHKLVNEEGVRPEDIIVLTPSGEKSSQWKKDMQLGNFIITWDMAARVSSVYRYKGLESPVVILTELRALREDIRDQLLYVGLSRARNHAVVLGELPKATVRE
jgi:superfamily I DNA and RNA helicase